MCSFFNLLASWDLLEGTLAIPLSRAKCPFYLFRTFCEFKCRSKDIGIQQNFFVLGWFSRNLVFKQKFAESFPLLGHGTFDRAEIFSTSIRNTLEFFLGYSVYLRFFIRRKLKKLNTLQCCQYV